LLTLSQHPFVSNCKGASVIVELIKKRQNAEAEQEDEDAPTEEPPKVWFPLFVQL